MIIKEKPAQQKPLEKLTISKDLFGMGGSLPLPPLPDISNQLQIFTYDPRPDEDRKEKYYEIHFTSTDKSNTNIQKANPHEQIFLCQDGGIKISDKPTNFYFSFVPLQQNIVSISVIGKYTNETGLHEIKKYFELQAKEDFLSSEPSCEELDFFSLTQGIFLGPDLSLDISSQSSSSNNVLNRLLFPTQKSLFIKPGDILIFKDNRWQLAGDTPTSPYSLARVASLKNSCIELDFWKSGIDKKRKIKLSKSESEIPLHISDDFISELNIRTKRQVSCKIAGQRMLIKEKEVLYKKDGLWKRGKLSDLEKINEASEFFVFDKLNVSPKDNVFIGYLFNKDKTQVKKIEKHILKNTRLSQRKKRR